MEGSDDDNDNSVEQLDSLDSSDDDTISCENDSSTDHAEQDEFIRNTKPKSLLEFAQGSLIKRQDLRINKLENEVRKLKEVISKRRQSYKRKRKDDQAPTRALSAYNIFVQERFSKLACTQLKNPASLVATTGDEWKNLSDEKKAKYIAMAEFDKKRYEKEMKGYVPPEKEGAKRSKTGYNMFFSAYVLQLRQSSEGVPTERGSVARLVGNAWKELNPEERQYYEQEAERFNNGNENNVKSDATIQRNEAVNGHKSSNSSKHNSESVATPPQPKTNNLSYSDATTQPSSIHNNQSNSDPTSEFSGMLAFLKQCGKKIS